MNIKKCPHCGTKQASFSFYSQRRLLSCIDKENYKCFYCTNCEYQISQPKSIMLLYLETAFILLISIISGMAIRKVLNIWSDYDLFFLDIPFILIVFIVIEVIKWNFIPLIKSTEKASLHIDPINIENSNIFTEKEKYMVKKTISIVTLFQGILMLFIFFRYHICHTEVETQPTHHKASVP